MLSRLMKYEMRSQSRLLLPLHALLLLASILGRFFITGKVYERVSNCCLYHINHALLVFACGHQYRYTTVYLCPVLSEFV